MKRLNRDGFTLIELLAVLMLLAIIMGIGSYSIIGIMNKSREKDYELLIENIYSAVEDYYIECKYDNGSNISCPVLDSGKYEIELKNLVINGYLKSNATDGSNNLVNPKVVSNDENNISDCKIKYYYTDGKINIEAGSSSGSCPNNCDYNPNLVECKK